jgi:hypothetical protein
MLVIGVLLSYGLASVPLITQSVHAFPFDLSALKCIGVGTCNEHENEQGPAGPAGPAGANGANGMQGPIGPAGANGMQGPIGPAGANGANGMQGPIGPAGANGMQGPIGPQGLPGAPCPNTSAGHTPNVGIIPGLQVVPNNGAGVFCTPSP